jgi:hypothetical protein
VAAGAAAAVAVLFKQPAASAGLALAGAVFVVWAGPGGLRRIGLAWLGMAAGALVVATSLLAFLAGHRALAHAWDCLFVYNRLYLRGVTLGERLDVLLYGLTRAGSAVPLWLGAGGFFLALAGAVSAVARQGTKAGFVSVLGRARHSPGWTFIGLWALFDLAGVCYPGYRSPHYFLQIVPSWLLLSAGFLRVVWPLQAGRGVLARWAGAAVLGATAVGLLAAAKAQADEALAAVRERMRERRFNRNEAMSFWVASYTEPDEAVAVWGAEATVNYLSGRCVASRYFFTYPMQMPGYDNERRVAEYLRDLERARPACIVDLSDESEWALPLFGGPKAVPRRFSCDPFDPVRDYVRRNYVHEPAVKVATVWVRRDLVERCRAWRQAGRRADWNERWRPGGRVR